MKVGDEVQDTKTGNIFKIVEIEEPTRRTPDGRYRLDDGHWRDGEAFLGRYRAGDSVRPPADDDGDPAQDSDGWLDSGGADSADEEEDAGGADAAE